MADKTNDGSCKGQRAGSILSRRPEVHKRRVELLCSMNEFEFYTCMDLGGYDGSFHSGDLAYLHKLGLVERKRFYVGISSGHWRYRLTQDGQDWLSE